MIENQLKQLGFNKNESKVYLALFDLGKCKAGQIIEQTKLHRNLVYTALDELVSKNLVSKMEKGKIAIFELNDPEVLSELMEEKLDTAKNIVEELRDRLKVKPRDVRIYEGTEGVITTRDYVAREIKPNEDYYVMGVSYGTTNKELREYFPKINKKIIQKGGAIKVLVNGNAYSDIISGIGLTQGDHARYLPFGADSPMWMTLFRDTMNISIAGQDPITFSIRSQETADGFKKYFEYFWNQETQILKGVEALKELWIEGIDCKEIRWIGARAYFVDRYPEIYQEIKTRAEKTPGIIWKNIIDSGFKEHPLTKLPWMETKYNLGEIRNPTAIWLFGDKVLIVNWAEDIPVILQSTNKHLVQSYSDYFEELWNKE